MLIHLINSTLDSIINVPINESGNKATIRSYMNSQVINSKKVINIVA